jgi:aspartate aminotransferase
MYSCPPAYGARIASTVLNTPELYAEWVIELKGMADRIMEMRKVLYELLLKKETPGTWNHIVDQIGMFTFTGLTPGQCKSMVDKYHIYLTMNGRISIAGLNAANVELFAESMDWVVRNVE